MLIGMRARQPTLEIEDVGRFRTFNCLQRRPLESSERTDWYLGRFSQLVGHGRVNRPMQQNASSVLLNALGRISFVVAIRCAKSN
jgi:hypothetical protein